MVRAVEQDSSSAAKTTKIFGPLSRSNLRKCRNRSQRLGCLLKEPREPESIKPGNFVICRCRIVAFEEESRGQNFDPCLLVCLSEKAIEARVLSQIEIPPPDVMGHSCFRLSHANLYLHRCRIYLFCSLRILHLCVNVFFKCFTWAADFFLLRCLPVQILRIVT